MRACLIGLFGLGLLAACDGSTPVAGPAAWAGVGIPGGSKCVAVELVPEHDTIPVGGTLQMLATALNKKGNAIPDALIQWASSYPDVAAVSSTGFVTGLSAGDSHILASCEGNVDSVLVVVGP